MGRRAFKEKHWGIGQELHLLEWSTMLWWQVLVFPWKPPLWGAEGVASCVTDLETFQFCPQNPAPGWYWGFINIWHLLSGIWKMTCSFMVGFPVWPFRAASFLGSHSTDPGVGWRTFRKEWSFWTLFMSKRPILEEWILEPSKGAQCRSLS